MAAHKEQEYAVDNRALLEGAASATYIQAAEKDGVAPTDEGDISSGMKTFSGQWGGEKVTRVEGEQNLSCLQSSIELREKREVRVPESSAKKGESSCRRS